MNSSYNNQTSDEDSGFERYCDVSEYDLYYLDTVESSPPSISSPIEQSLLPMSNPIEQSQLLMCNPNEQNQLSISNPVEQSQLPMSNPIEQSLLPMSNPIEQSQLLMCNPNEQNQLSISNPVEQSQLPMSNPIEQSQLLMCNPNEQNQLSISNPVEQSQLPMSNPIEQSLLPMSNPIEQSQLLMCNPNEQNQLSISNPVEQSQLPMSNPIEQSLLPMSNPIEHYQTNTLFHNRIYEDSSTHFANDDNLHYYRNKLNLNFPRNQDKDYHKNSCCINQNCNQHCNPDSFGISNVSIHPNVNASAMYFSRHRALFDVLPRQKRRQNFGPESFQNKYYQILSGHKLNKEKVQQIHNEFLVRDLHFNKMRSCEFRSIKKYFKKYEEKQDEILNYLQENRKRIVARFGII